MLPVHKLYIQMLAKPLSRGLLGSLPVNADNGNPRQPDLEVCLTGISYGGPYRDRTDDIHGVNVALYQLS